MRNGWAELAVLDPDSNQIQVFKNGRFHPNKPGTEELPKAASSTDWHRGQRDHWASPSSNVEGRPTGKRLKKCCSFEYDPLEPDGRRPRFPTAADWTDDRAQAGPLSERTIGWAVQAATMAGLLWRLAILILMLLNGDRHAPVELGSWVAIPEYHFSVKFVFDRLSVPFVILSFVLGGTVGASPVDTCTAKPAPIASSRSTCCSCWA